MNTRPSPLALMVVAGLATPAAAQMAPPPSREVPWGSDSGPVWWQAGAGRDQGPRAVYSTTVTARGAAWVRLRFSAVQLAGVIEEGSGSYLKLTSLADGDVQHLNAETASQWGNTSAYFNGESVLVELMAHPGTGVNRLAIAGLTAGEPAPGAGTDTICFGADDRVLSFDNRAARHSTGCTSWLIMDTNRQFLTAGHCGTVGSSVMSFNVPLSNGNGSIVQAPARDQYPVDGASIQSNGGQGVGNDYAYFGVFPNTQTGLMPAQAYGGAAFPLQLPPAMSPGQTIRITGYGTTSSPISPTWNQVQKTHAGQRVNPQTGVAATTLSYQTDTTGGNSGSPVILEGEQGTHFAIGIHTHGTCGTTAGNNGTGLNHAALQNAMNNPTGVCRSGRGTPAGTLYASSDAVNNFGTCNPATGAFAKVAFAPPRMEGLAYAPTIGRFYGVSNDTYTAGGGVPPGPAGPKLWTIDPATGAAAYIANISGVAGVINGLGYEPASNLLYGVIQATGTRVTINPATAVAAIDGVSNAGTVIGAAEYNPADFMLYGIDDGGGASKLVRFTPATGTVQVIGPLGAGIADCNGLAITESGEFYTINAANEQLLRINPATGAATVVGGTLGSFGASFGMSAVVPPPVNPCYANCDGSTALPILNVSDFGCFLTRYAAGEAYANCDGSTQAPVLNVSDFGCFLSKYAAGCP